MKLKKGVKFFLFILIGIVGVFGVLLASYYLFIQPDPIELFKKSLENMYLSSKNSIANQPMINLSKYEMYGRLQQTSDDLGNYNLDYKVGVDKSTEFLDLEYSYLNDSNEIYSNVNLYKRNDNNLIEYPEVLNKLIIYETLFEEDSDLSNPLPIEALDMAYYTVFELECFKKVAINFFDEDKIVMKEFVDDYYIYMASYKMNREETLEFYEKNNACLEENSEYIEYIEKNHGKTFEEIKLDKETSNKDLNSSEIIVYTDSDEKFLKFELKENEISVITVEKTNNSMQFDFINEDLDSMWIEISDKIFDLKSSYYSAGNIVKINFKINFDAITKNRATGDMDILIKTTNKNETSELKMIGNFTFNKKDVELRIIDSSNIYNYTDLTYDEAIRIYNYLNTTVDNPAT